MHDIYKIHYPDGVGKNAFAARLRSLGYEVKRAGQKNTISVYVTRSGVDVDERLDDDDLEGLAQLALGQ